MLRSFLSSLAVLLLVTTAPAGTLAIPGTTKVAIPPDLPERLLKQLNKAKLQFLEEAAALIMGYGNADGIDPAGIEIYIATSRAKIRASAIERLLAGDLDNDGAISRGELATLVAIASAAERGRLQLSFTTADLDQGGLVSAEELRAFGQTKALDRFDDAAASDWRQFMLFDLDGNGRVALPEVIAVANLLKQAS